MLFSLTKTSVGNGDALNSHCQLPTWSQIALYNYQVGDLREDTSYSVSVILMCALLMTILIMDVRVFYFLYTNFIHQLTFFIFLCLGMLYIKKHLF